ncbi:unnamed protein product [Lactuca saligna]|uniref:Transposase MuDR plant domain-containing protein n=1 Tax=Lactuca saligna TaxID=75948 RepID=A0AA35ZGY9_LACSI|nr:unnamed protein product [Lactuca saligna]
MSRAASVSRDSLNIDVYHQGVFSPNPLVYFHPDKVPVMGLDVHGLRELRDEDDYVRFVDAGFDDDDNQISIYIDDHHEPLLDWIEEEKAEEWDSGTETYEDDVDSKNLIPQRGIEEEAGGKVKKHPIHDPNQKWDTMMPELGMKFSDRDELKHMLTNYAVSKGYSLWYEKNEAKALLVRCSKNEKGKPSCPFRLWASPMNKENSFQIKSLIDKHNCARQQKLGCIVTYKWIGKMLIPDILERPKFSYRKMAEVVRKDYGLKVSLGQCRNAKYFALDEISGNLVSHYEKLWNYANKATVSEGDVEEGISEGDVEEGISQDGISEDGVNEDRINEDGVSEVGIGEEEAVEEGDIEDHQEDEIEQQEDEIDHQENHHHQHQPVFFSAFCCEQKAITF